MATVMGLCSGPALLPQTPKTTDTFLRLPPVENRWALVIGVGKYDDEKAFPPLPGDRDAKIIAKALVKYGGFRRDQVILVSDESKNPDNRPTYKSINHWLSYISTRSSPNDLWLIAFSGHGIHRDTTSNSVGGDFLVPSEAIANENPALVSIESVKGYLRQSQFQQAILLLDFCRNNADRGNDTVKSDTLSALTIRSLNFEKMNSNIRAAAVVFATSEGQSAYVDHANNLGFFSEYLVNGLAGEAASPTGDVTLASLIGYLDKEVPARVHHQFFEEHLDTISKQVPESHVFGYRSDQLVLADAKAKSQSPGEQSPALMLAAEPIEQTDDVSGPVFSSPVDYPVGGRFPNSVAVGDFNGDGKADIVTANSDTNDVSVLLGNGDGTFQPARRYPAGSVPYTIAVGDFNGDGKLDVAVANIGYQGHPSISVLLGRGDGSFEQAKNYPSNNQPTKLAIGDFNGDGKPDLVVGNRLDGTVSVLLGNGDGTFQAPVTYAVGRVPYSVAVGDFNKDGKKDLVVANNGSHSVSVLLGNGDGSFAPHEDYLTDTGRYGPYSVQVGDFDRDGKEDLLFADFSDNAVGLLLGNGDGTFQGKSTFSVGDSPFDVVIADFDGDGNLDVATANNSNSVSVLLGNGDGTFQSAKNYPGENSPCSVAVADFNGDGRPDLVTANRAGDSISVLLNISNQTTLVLTSSQNPSVFGSKVTFTARVATDFAVAQGVVEFRTDNVRLGSGQLMNGVVSVESYALAVGSHVVSAKFKGSAQFGGSSATLNQTVVAK
jgi:hypothetical protein